MATQFAVDLVFKSQTRALEQVSDKLQGVDRTADKLKGKNPFQGVERGAKSAGDAAARAGKQAEAAAGGFDRLGKAVGGLVSAYALLSAGKFVIAKTAELETQTRSIQVLTGSLEKAKGVISELQQFANVTPFTSTELIETAKRLKAFGVDTEKLVDTTKRLGDVAGATGADLSGIATAYGQIMAKGRLQGEELLQLQERGINLQSELQKMYGLTGDEFRDALEKGKFSAQAVELALKRLTDAGGTYANGAIAQSDTLAGKFSTLQDNIENVAKTLGQVLTPAFNVVLNEAIKLANQINEVMQTTLLMQNLGGAMSTGQRDKWWQEAGKDAESIAKLRNNGMRDFPAIRDQLFRDKMRQYGYDSGLFKPPTAAAPTAGPSAVPALLGGTSKAGAGGKANADKKLVTLTGLAMAAGFSPADARIMAAIALAESGGNPMAHNPNASTGDNSYGLWQINMLGAMGPERRRSFGLSSNEQLFDPATNARAARQVHGSQGFGAWSVYRSGAYKQFLGQDAEVGGVDAGDIAGAWLDAQKAIEDSLKAGQKLSQDFTRQLELRNAATETERKLLQIGYDYADRQEQIKELMDSTQKTQLTALNDRIRELEVISAELDALYERAELERQITEEIGKRVKEMDTGGKFRTDIDLDPNKTQGKIQDYMDKLKTELADTEAMIVSLAQSIETELGSAMSNAIIGLVQGTQTVEQAMSQMFGNIGKAFIDMATQMIAKALVLKVLGLLNPGGGGGLFSGAGPYQFPSGGGFNGFVPTLPKLYADGGFVTGPTRAIIGEGGEPEYVLPASKMPEAMNRYAAGRRGSSVIPDSSGGGGAGGGGGHYTLETVVINNVEYATVEQVRAMGRQSAQQGAAGGHSRVMGDLRNRRSTRSRLGLA